MPVQPNPKKNEIAEIISDLFPELKERNCSATIGEQTSIYRQKTLLKTLKKVRLRVEDWGLTLKTPPLKFVIHFMENCSLEDSEDNTLIDMYKNLLISSATDYQPQNNIFVRILNEIGPDEIKIFQLIAYSHLNKDSMGFYTVEACHVDDSSSFWDEPTALYAIKNTIDALEFEFTDDAPFHLLEKHFMKSYQKPGTIITSFQISKEVKNSIQYEIIYDQPYWEENIYFFDSISVNILKSFGLINELSPQEYFFGEYRIAIDVCFITSLGASFYQACGIQERQT